MNNLFSNDCPMKYSQRDEQEHILKACETAQRRQLLDIGAFHPTEMSNSRALIEEGWSAVLIEPSPGPVRNLVQEYGKNVDVHVICAAVSMTGGIMDLAITDDAVSTSDPRNEAKWKDRGGYFGSMLIPTLTIPQILNRFGAFDFCNIDAEGTSVDLLKVLLATEMFPRCICVEYDDRLSDVIMVSQERGYKAVYVSAENVVMVHG